MEFFRPRYPKQMSEGDKVEFKKGVTYVVLGIGTAAIAFAGGIFGIITGDLALEIVTPPTFFYSAHNVGRGASIIEDINARAASQANPPLENMPAV